VVLDDRYRLDGVLGRGSSAEVYAATDLRLHRRVAVKVFPERMDEVAFARFIAEAQLLAGLVHPSLLRVFDVNPDCEKPYLVTRLLAGQTLRQRLRAGPLPPAEVARIGGHCADALDHVHSRQIVHRDVKPANVLLDDDECVLADFGIARALDAARLTSTGLCVGTAGYLAPEQVRGDAIGPPADVYSLGLVLLECLTGEAEYPGPEVEAALARLGRSPRLPDWLPTGWSALLNAMTATDPADRPSAATCARTLARLAADISATTLVGRPVTSPVTSPVAPVGDEPEPTELVALPAVESVGPRWRATRAVLASSAVACLAIAVLLAVFAQRPQQSERNSDPPAVSETVVTPSAAVPPATQQPAVVSQPTAVAPAVNNGQAVQPQPQQGKKAKGGGKKGKSGG
jgi:serine/threonine protein kinase